MITFSIDQNAHDIDLEKCRVVLGKVDRLELYSKKIIQKLFEESKNIREIPFFKLKNQNCFFYFLNLGLKKNQFYFAVFSSLDEIQELALEQISLFSISHLRNVEKIQDLHRNQELIHIDDVTGLYNQRKLYKDINQSVDKFSSEKEPFCVLFIDIDHFKRVNDSYGHLIGTKLLENVAQDIKNLLRDSDSCYRYGGDEFVIILGNSDEKAGKIVGERILKKIKSRQYQIDFVDASKTLKLSVSIGVAGFPQDARSSDEILAIADRMMYEAKESGRGLVFNTQDVFKTSLRKIVENN